MTTLNPADVEYFGRGKWENPRFWNRLGGQPDLRGKKVLDLGCGHGSLCVDMAKAGAARVVGIDLNPRLIEFAKRNLEINYPELLGRVEFYLVDIAEFPEYEFDLMTSKDTFEHVMDLPKVLAAMRERLKPGGRQNAQVYVCPSHRRKDELKISYALNSVAGFIPEAQVERIAQFAVLIDEQETLNDGHYRAFCGIYYCDCPSFVHTGGANYTFFDGHARWYRSLKERPRIRDCNGTVDPRIFCPKIPFFESLDYAYYCMRE